MTSSFNKSIQQLFIFFLIAGIAAACKQPETIVVDRNPETAAAGDTVQQAAPAKQQASFKQINVGELQPIRSLDPILASTRSELHAIQLIYEGLVRFDESGNIVPAVAKEWSTSNNDHQYTFHLRSDIFFQDSDIFGSGTGRKLTANDVKFVFRRMATPRVPDRAARLFMNIKGFEAYYREQHYVFNASSRQLDGISGITAPNDTTVVFNLDESDPDFLQKLATPLAVIYPREAANDQGGFEPVGTGPFSFSQKANDSTFIFAKFQNYYEASNIKLNRIDLVTSSSESGLWQAMESGDIHYLPEMGPMLTQQLTTENEKLNSAYSDRYSLIPTNASTKFTLRRYTGSNISPDMGADIAQMAQSGLDSLFAGLNGVVTNTSYGTDDSKLASSPNLQINATTPEGPFERTVFQHLGKALAEENIQFSTVDMHIPTKETGLFFIQSMPLIPGSTWQEQPEILSFTLQPYMLSHQSVEGIGSNQYAWWIDLRNTNILALENIN